MIPVEVTGISISPPYQGYVVILKEKDGEQWLPIFIGATEAHTISLLLQGLKYVRPLTYDLFQNLLDASAAKVSRVEVTDLKENTFYATVYVDTQDGRKEVDARPSDAIALALKTDADIFVAPHVFTEAGMRGEIAQAETTGPSKEDKLMELNRRLKEAVEKEEYEEAARIRDEIKVLESVGGEHAPEESNGDDEPSTS
ncbi:bifunctional nuclease family protein [bacterium]|nr:bifunctional nuclease family protein [bacterium]